ncbi:MAG: DUF3786 domain-containing protein [Desulfobacteraceae bacterium]|nr:DUF3786 domain-containing protein [Desulfobacteraceae bacterium]
MTDNYEKILRQNLERLYADLPDDLADSLPAEQQGSSFKFTAFGETCVISPEGITLDGSPVPSVLGILISLYALHARPEACTEQPFKAFKEFPDSMPYVGAFTTHTEQILAPHTEAIQNTLPQIKQTFCGKNAPEEVSGDFAFVVYPLPKIALCYIFYEADEDFPASATCLYSQNADLFLPIDGLADTGEYTSRKILEIVGK